MRKFRINVNGVSYDVDVEELSGAPAYAPAPAFVPAAPVAAAAPVMASVPAAAPAAAPEAAPAAPAGPVPEGVQLKCPMPGTILDVKVSLGDTVAEGDLLMILEAMKMENELFSPAAGKIVSLVSSGSSANPGDVLAVIA